MSHISESPLIPRDDLDDEEDQGPGEPPPRITMPGARQLSDSALLQA